MAIDPILQNGITGDNVEQTIDANFSEISTLISNLQTTINLLSDSYVSPKMTTLLAKATSENYLAPSTTAQGFLNRYMYDLAKDANPLQYLDLLYAFGTDGSSDFASLNVIDPDGFEITREEGTSGEKVTFSPSSGFRGNGGHLNTHFRFASDPTQLTQDSIFIGLWVKENHQNTNSYAFGVNQSGSQIGLYNRVGNRIEHYTNSTSAATYSPESNVSDNSFYAIVRTDNSTVKLYKNGVEIDSESNSSGSLSVFIADLLLLAVTWSTGNPEFPIDMDVLAFMVGSGSVDQLQAYQATNTYISSCASLSTQLTTQYNFGLAGQSNALGNINQAAMDTAGVGVTFPVDGVNYWASNDTFQTHTERTNYIGHFNVDAGVEDRICEMLMNRNSKQVNFIKYTQGSTSLVDGPWDADNGALAQAFIDKAVLSSVNYNSVIWIQGEDDANSLGKSQNYETELSKLMTRFRNEIPGNPKIYVVRLFAFPTNLPYTTEIQTAQENVCSSLSFCELVTPPASLQVAGNHYTALGIDGLARHIFENHITADIG